METVEFWQLIIGELFNYNQFNYVRLMYQVHCTFDISIFKAMEPFICQYFPLVKKFFDFYLEFLACFGSFFSAFSNREQNAS